MPVANSRAARPRAVLFSGPFIGKEVRPDRVHIGRGWSSEPYGALTPPERYHAGPGTVAVKGINEIVEYLFPKAIARRSALRLSGRQ